MSRLRAAGAAVAANPSIAVAAAVLVTAVYFTVQALRVDEYIWLIDELLYVKIAQSFAGGELLRSEVYGEPVSLPNALYPRLLAPLYALFGSITAFKAAHVLNALAFSSVIVPVYLLARRLAATWWLALLAATAAAWVPWSVAVSVVMTESVAYAAFAWAVFACVAALDRPRALTHALALVAIALAAYARVQFALLLPLFVVAVLLQAVAAQSAAQREGRPPLRLRERLRPHVPLAWMLGAVVALVALLSLTGTNPAGSYETAVDRERFPPGWLDSAAWHLGHVVVGVGIVPAVLWLAFAARTAFAPRNQAQLGFAVFSVLIVAALVYTAGDFAQNVAGGVIQERYLFYIAPLFLAGAAALLSDVRLPRPGLSLVGAALLVAGVVAVPNYDPAAGNDGFGIVAAAFSGFVRVIEGRSVGLRDLWPGDRLGVDELLVIATFVAALLLVALTRVRRQALVGTAVLGLVLAYCAAETHYLLDRAIPSINGNWQRLAGESDTPRDWIDDALPGGSEVAIIPARLFVPPGADAREVTLRAQFWNETITDAYVLADRVGTYSGLPFRVLKVDERTGAVASEGEETRYVAVSRTDSQLRLRGELVARSAYGLDLLRPERPYRAAWVAVGGFPEGYSVGTAERLIRVFDERASAISLILTAPGEADDPVRFEARFGGRTARGVLEPGESTTVELPLPPGRVREVAVRALGATRLDDDRRVGLLVAPLELR